MTSLERKLNALNKCKKQLKPTGTKTSQVRALVSKVETAFSDYIRSDNVNTYSAVKGPLLVTIEDHTDFQTAVGYIDRAIRSTQNAIEAEERAKRAAAQARQEA